MKRLRALDVHEISLVKSAANARKYLIRKRAEEGSMPDVQSIHEQLLAVPQTTVLAIEAVAKSAGDDDGMNEEAQAAMKAAGRILAPHADNLTSEQVTKLMQAIGMLAQDKADTDANAADAQQNANDADIEDAEGANKAAPKAGNKDQRDAEEIDEEEQEAQKADKPKWLHDKIKGKAEKEDAPADEDDDEEEDVDKTGGASGPGMGEPYNVSKDFDESKHPRSENGEFGNGGGGGKGSGSNEGAPSTGRGKALGSKGILGVTNTGKTIRADGEMNEKYTKKDHKEAYVAHADKASAIAQKHGSSDPRAVHHAERAKFHNTMSQVNKSADGAVLNDTQMRYASDTAQDAAPNPLESTVAKSAHLDLSGFTEAQRAALEPITKSHAALADSHRALEAAHKEAVAKSQALQHKLDRKEFVAKAAAYPHLGKADELGALMHNLHDKDPDSFAAWEGVLKTANAAQDSSALFEERGSRLSESGSAAADMDKAVAAFVQKSATGLSRDQAMDAFLKTDEGKQLYRLERAEAHAAQRRG